MAQRRMFSKTIVRSDSFLNMPGSTRLLYYDLGMEADDDGFVQARMVMALSGAKEDDYRVLIAKGFIIEFEDKVVIIRDWKVNNEIRQDRYKETFYKNHKEYLQENEQRQYILINQGENMVVPNDNHLDTQYRLGKDSISNIHTSSATPTDGSFELFWNLYPKKVEKKKSELKWKKISPTIQKKILEDLPKRKMQSQWLKGYIPNPLTYLNGERWNDEYENEAKNEILTFDAVKTN